MWYSYQHFHHDATAAGDHKQSAVKARASCCGQSCCSRNFTWRLYHCVHNPQQSDQAGTLIVWSCPVIHENQWVLYTCKTVSNLHVRENTPQHSTMNMMNVNQRIVKDVRVSKVVIPCMSIVPKSQTRSRAQLRRSLKPVSVLTPEKLTKPVRKVQSHVHSLFSSRYFNHENESPHRAFCSHVFVCLRVPRHPPPLLSLREPRSLFITALTRAQRPLGHAWWSWGRDGEP